MKIKMLADEILSNVVEDGVDKGPKHVYLGEEVEVWDAVGEMLIEWGRATRVKATKHTEQPKEESIKEEKPKKSKK